MWSIFIATTEFRQVSEMGCEYDVTSLSLQPSIWFPGIFKLWRLKKSDFPLEFGFNI